MSMSSDGEHACVLPDLSAARCPNRKSSGREALDGGTSPADTPKDAPFPIGNGGDADGNRQSSVRGAVKRGSQTQGVCRRRNRSFRRSGGGIRQGARASHPSTPQENAQEKSAAVDASRGFARRETIRQRSRASSPIG